MKKDLFHGYSTFMTVGWSGTILTSSDNGTKQWTKQYGSSSSDGGFGVTVDNSSNIYVTGYSKGGLDGNTNSGYEDIFLMKFNSDGVLQ